MIPNHISIAVFERFCNSHNASHLASLRNVLVKYIIFQIEIILLHLQIKVIIINDYCQLIENWKNNFKNFDLIDLDQNQILSIQKRWRKSTSIFEIEGNITYTPSHFFQIPRSWLISKI